MKKVFPYFFYVCFSPRGRINRAWFWLYVLLAAILRFGMVEGFGMVEVMSQGAPFLVTLNYMVVDVAMIYQGTVVTIKRLHDTNRSGWYLLLGLITQGIYILIVCGFFKGTDGDNTYGEPSYLIEKEDLQ